MVVSNNSAYLENRAVRHQNFLKLGYLHFEFLDLTAYIVFFYLC